MLVNVNKSETIDYDELEKEILQDLNDGNVNIVLTAAEYYIYKYEDKVDEETLKGVDGSRILYL